jgi:glucose/arabinose dehydrogenase
VNRLSRWTWNPTLNEIDPDSEVVLLDTPSAARAQHNSGKIEFGKDGYLYVTIGDTGVNDEGQTLNTVLGTMVRLTDTGDIPPDNPFANDPEGVHCNVTGRGDGKCQEIYAVGLRNPWRFAMDPNTSGNKVRFFINDVGASAWEEINEGGDDFEDNSVFNYNLGVQNFGWPIREGPCIRGRTGGCDDYEGYIHPIHYWQHEGE